MSEAAAAAESREHRESPTLKHFANAGDAVLKQWGSLIPDAFWTHGKVARKEFLLGVTSLVDEVIHVIDPEGAYAPAEEPDKPVRKRTTRKVKVEVE